MDQLIIKLTGTIQSSNFEHWKLALQQQINSVNTHLVSDEDFALASRQVTLFKSAETTLKNAKQSAIDQAADIQKLFDAIDAITELSRQTRLTLERQIKNRKIEIKQQLIRDGMNKIKTFIDHQPSNLQAILTKQFLNQTRFEQAIERKANLDRVQSAIAFLCAVIQQEIHAKLLELQSNVIQLEQLPEAARLLFPDQDNLLELSPPALQLTIEKRLAQQRATQETQRAEQASQALARYETLTLNPSTSNTSQTATPEPFRIVLDIYAEQQAAIEFARTLKTHYQHHPLVKEIHLKRPHHN